MLVQAFHSATRPLIGHVFQQMVVSALRKRRLYNHTKLPIRLMVGLQDVCRRAVILKSLFP